MNWFRLYHNIVDDPKIRLMSDEEQLLWIWILCLASMSSCRGSILMSDDEVCFRLRISIEFWKSSKEKFRCKNLIDFGKGSEIVITNWDTYQYTSDSSVARTRKYRDKRKRATGCDVTQPSPRRVSDGLDPDSDLDLDQESDLENRRPIVSYADAKDAPALKQGKGTKNKTKTKTTPKLQPEAFENWWKQYYEFCLSVSQSAGRRNEAAAAWDLLLGSEDCLVSIMNGTNCYSESKRQQFASKGEAIGISHGVGYLRDRKWEEAL